MILKPHEWNTIVAGSWNPAIFTPKGIAELLFQKKSGEPIEVMVPLDGLGAPRVMSNNMIVMLESTGRLIIESKDPTFEMLDQTRELALRAVEALPRTPLAAAGFNFRYRVEDPSESFLALLDTRLDSLLSSVSFKIESRGISRSLEHETGRLNLIIEEIGPNKFALQMNVERRSQLQKDLIEWLKMNMDDMRNVVKKILSSVLGVSEEEIQA